MKLPELGVGITYFPGLEPVLDRHAGSIQILEIEPQTFWTRRPDGSFRIHHATLGAARSYPCAKLVHGIGAPVGGTLLPDPAQVVPMLRMLQMLGPAWMSEHLSFNRIRSGEGEQETLFLLPPRQTADGVCAAVRAIQSMAVYHTPIAVETPVSYLRPRADEMEDGKFLRAVVEAADCGIVLDLHNLWVNERCGRQSVEDFLKQIPLDRVWEVHVAGGEEHQGFWLDAHSGPMDDAFFEMAERAIAQLPSLKALIFEMAPAYVPRCGMEFFDREFERLHRLWDLRGKNRRKITRLPEPLPEPWGPTAEEWEDALGRVAIGCEPANDFERSIADDPGMAVVKDLIEEFRAGYVMSSLRLSSRLLMLKLGKDGFWSLLREFWAEEMPRSFASDEGAAFAKFLKRRDVDVPHLMQIVDFDLALLAAQSDGKPRLVSFSVAPLPILRALGAGKFPEEFEEGEYELTVTPDAA